MPALELSTPYNQKGGVYWIGNLETPLVSDTFNIRPKSGPTLRGSPLLLNHLRNYLSPITFNLANNHIMDFGECGLRNTIDLCRKSEICTFGAGLNLNQAQAPLIMNIDGYKIAFVGCCETQFGTANVNRAGVNPVNSRINKMIRDLSQIVDIVIVSIHGAAEMCPWPSPSWQDLLRSFVDAGAKIVHGHHSHVPQGYECYNGGLIAYGLGNFVVDPKAWKVHANTLWSLTIIADLFDPAEMFSIYTNIVEDNGNKVSVRHMTDEESKEQAVYLSKCNEALKSRPLLEGLWQEAAVRMFNLWFSDRFGYRMHSTCKNRFRVLYRCSRDVICPSNPTKEQLLYWYHLFACESHIDTISTAFGLLSGEHDDFRTAETCKLVDEMMPWSTKGSS